MKKRHLALGIGGAIAAAAAVKLLTRATTVEWENVRDQVFHAEHSHFIYVDGIKVHYQEFGDNAAPPVVLIHGYTASVYVWKAAAPLLAEAGFRVIAVDLVGFGYSEKPSWFDYSIQSQARMILRLMDRLGVGRATVIGSSYGGAVALNLTLDHPARVEKLVLVDTVCNDEPLRHPILRLTSIRGVGELLTPFIADSKLFLRKRMHSTIAKANHHLITQERIDNVRRPLLSRQGHHSLLATSRNWSASRLEQDAHLIDCPTLIVWGENDTVIPIRNGYKLRSEIPDSRMVVLNDCGHVPQEERSKLFTQLVSEFIHGEKESISDGILDNGVVKRVS